MKNRKVGALLLSLFCVGLLSFGALYLRQRDRQSAIDTSLHWARMLPLPDSANNVDVAVEGSIFTREFEIEFQASEEDIKTWLASSPGTAFSPQYSSTEDTKTYKISEPNAMFAQVQVNWETLTVVIHAYWS